MLPQNSTLRWMRKLDTLMMTMVMTIRRMMITHLMPALPWPHEDFARSSSNILFQTAKLTEDDEHTLCMEFLTQQISAI